ncbi:MAG: cytochrome c family protein [Geminicoccaceae bacterium]
MASSLEGNKVLGAILTAGIIASGAGFASRILYSPHMLEEPVFKVAVEDTTAAETEAAEATPETPLPVLLAAASAEAGEKVSKKCASCHDFSNGGPNKVGPNLWGVVGRPVGKHEGFAYSEAMAGHGGNWTWDDLNHFITAPKDYMPGTKMSFAGLSKDTERADLLAYLRTLSDSPVELPAAQ